jgi:hypothetical protein
MGAALRDSEGRSSWGTGDAKGSASLRLRHTPCLLLILSFRTQFNKDYGYTTPIEVAAVGTWLAVGGRVGTRPQKNHCSCDISLSQIS